MPDIVTLNGKKYSVDEIRSRTIKAWADPVRVTGNEARVDRRNASAWNQESLRAGMGYYVCIGPVPDDPSQAHRSYIGCFDSTVETRYEGIVTLAGLPEAVTVTNSSHDYYRFASAGGNGFNNPTLYAFSSTINQSIGQLNATGATLGSYKDLTSGYTTYRPVSATEDGNGIVKFWGGTLTSTATPIVSIAATGSATDFTPSTNMSHAPLSVVIYKDILWATTIERTTNRLQIEKSTDAGDNWANVTGLTLNVAGSQSLSADHQADLIIYEDFSGFESLYLVTNDKLYFVDTTNSLFKLIIDFGSYIRNSESESFGRPEVWGGNLYIPRHSSLIEYNARSGFWDDISPVTQLRMNSGYIAKGHNGIVALAQTGKYLFVGFVVNGTTSGGKILAYDGFGWHFIWTSAGDASGTLKDIAILTTVSKDEDLYIIMDDNSSTASSMYKIAEINRHPEMSTTKKYIASGALIMPWFTAGMSEVDAAWLAQGGGYKDLDSTNEEVNVDFAIDFSETYQTDAATLADFNADTVSLIKLGTGTTRGGGVKGRAIRNRYTLSRGSTNTLRPIMVAPVTYYKKKPKRLHEYGMLVNLEESAKLDQSLYQSSPGKVLRTLHTTEETVTLVNLKFAGQHEITLTNPGTDLFVDVQEIPSTTRALPENQWLPQIKEGTALVVCQQVLD